MIQRTVLDNGLRLLSEEVSGMASVTVGIWVENGSRDEEQHENGISHFLEHLFFKGTERRSAANIAEEMDAIGGVLDAFTGKEYTCYYAHVLNEHLPLALDLLLDVFLHSQFPAEEIERERSVICQEIAQIEDAPDELVHDLFDLDFWRGHPLSWPISGTAVTVSRLQRENFLRFLRRRYTPDRVLLAMAGGARHEQLVDAVADALGTLQGSAIDYVSPPPTVRFGVYAHPRNLEQTHLCLGTASVSQLAEEWFAAYLLNTSLGGGMSSRLFQEIREQRGLAYEVTSFLSSYRDTGCLGVYVATSAEWAREVVDIICSTLTRIATEGISEEELRRAKGHTKGGMLLGLETSEARMNRLARCEIYFRRYISPQEVVESIERVTLDDVQSLASRCFRSEERTLTMLGEVPRVANLQSLLDS